MGWVETLALWPCQISDLEGLPFPGAGKLLDVFLVSKENGEGRGPSEG